MCSSDLTPVLPVLALLTVVLMLAYLDREAAGIGAAILAVGALAGGLQRLVSRR